MKTKFDVSTREGKKTVRTADMDLCYTKTCYPSTEIANAKNHNIFSF